jgi:hypothetical protein
MQDRNVWGVALALFALSSTAAAAQPIVRLGSEFQVNTYTLSEQSAAGIGADASGNVAVIWHSFSEDGDGFGIFAQRYASAGGPVGTEFQVNTYTLDSQDNPAIAVAPGGDFVVTWGSRGQDGHYSGVFARRFDSGGAPLGGEFQVNTYTPFRQYNPAVASDPSGAFMVVWRSGDFFGGNQDGDGFGVFGQRFDSDGSPAGTEFQINSYTPFSQDFPAVSSDAAGNFVVVWTSTFQDGSAEGVFGQRFDSSGAPLGTEFQINTYTNGFETFAKVGSHPNGDFVVTFTDSREQGRVAVRRYSSTGMPIGTEFVANNYTPSGQYAARVAADADGFVVAWNSYLQDGSFYGIFGRRYDSSGAPLASEFQVNSYTVSGQSSAQIALNPLDAGFTIVWESHNQDGIQRGIFGQRFGPVCPPVPAEGCRTAAKSLLLIKQNSDNTKDGLIWKWIKGQMTSAGEFADPTDATTYAFCVYDNGALKLPVTVPSGCSGTACWAEIPGKGYQYKDETGSNDGIRKLLLKGSAVAKSKGLLKGKGLNLPDPPSVQFVGPVKAQLINTTSGLCFEGSYSSAQFKKNDPDFFKGLAVEP